ncbi:uncharacterized protein AB675_2722 [Cyphellophora attinorum]|uniref:Uncharacterized protein n=1 Tax=Cyphellophora attinorum TaxID=1664694 RepID=A0A0N1HGM4_9EURO|nr:uncharacterized protein AB675_2722 [Phialophora attinorum]KPI44853.1 hypothetical protein AB675_2722 [Phialophora attinorum]
MDPRPSPINWVIGQMPHPPGVQRRAAIESSTAAGETDIELRSASLTKRDSEWGLVCKYQESGDQPMREDEKMTRLCIDPPYGYNCDKRGQRTRSGKQSGTCDDQCFCRNMNPKPRVLGWVYDQVPASGSWRKLVKAIFGISDGKVDNNTIADGGRSEMMDADKDNSANVAAIPQQANSTSRPGAEAHIESDDKATTTYDGQQEQTSPRFEPSSGGVELMTRHEYAVVCELDGQRDSKVTEACRRPPRVYSCDANGRLSKRKYDYYCDQHCACQDMNPKPLRVDVPMGSIPNPCHFCKRDADDDGDRESSPGGTELMDGDVVDGEKTSFDVVWVLDCSYQDGTQDLALVRQCHLERNVSCSADGQLQSEQPSVDGRCAAVCFCYQRPV